MSFCKMPRGSTLKNVITVLALVLFAVAGYFVYKQLQRKPPGRVPGTTANVVPPEGVAPFDPKPLMDKLAERTAQTASDPRGLMEKLRERTTTDKFRFAVWGDSKHADTLPAFIKYLEETVNPDFMITTGDMVKGGGGMPGPGWYEKLAGELGPTMRKYPCWPAIGNHEVAGNPVFTGSKGEDEQLRANQRTGVENFKLFYNLEKEYYSFSFRNCYFIALPFPMPDAKQTEWLEAELKKASAEKKHIFVFNHAAFFTVGSKNSSDIPNKETPITALFQKYGVAAVFSGHDHGYYRTIRSGIPYMISAGGGAQIYEGKRIKEAVPGDIYYCGVPGTYVNGKTDQYMLHKNDGSPDKITHVMDQFMCVIDVDGDKINCFTVTAKGEKWDEFQLSK